MRQLLILGFYCGVYRREPRCRVYANDVLLDEFDIPHTPIKKINFPSVDILDPLKKNFLKKIYLNNLKTHPPFLKYIEFDDDTGILDIKLKIQNDDNNYSNGFMTKFTHVVLPYVYLSSKKSLENINNIKNNYKYSRQNWEKYYNITGYYADDNRNYFFKNLADFMKIDFPGIKINPSSELITHYKVGSTGCFHLTLQKKLGFWKPNTDVYKGVWYIPGVDFIEYFYDKYKQYEDQRSANT